MISIVPVITGALLAAILLLNFTGKQEVVLEEFALGKETTSFYRSVDGVKIHCKDAADSEECLIEARKKANDKKIALWLGNSQVHAVNQAAPQDLNAPPILFKKLQENGYYLVTFSQPNANLQEHYLLYEYIKAKLRVDMLILPLVFDDTRETGVRQSISLALSEMPVRQELGKTPVGQRIIDAVGEAHQGNGDNAGLAKTTQEAVEIYLNQELNETVPLWEQRPKLRGQIFLSLYQFRNLIFNINPSSERKIIPERYGKNIESFKAILDSAKKDETRVLSYIVPIRNDVKIPYVVKEYDAFKSEVTALANRVNVRIRNYESLIPAQYWGTKGSTELGGSQELDFMHFQTGGHQLLANKLYQDIVAITGDRYALQ